MPLTLPDPALDWADAALRPWAVADAGQLVAAWTDELVARWNPVPPEPTIERAERWIAGCDQRLADGRSVDLCIVEPESDVLGEVGLSGFDHERGAAMVGYWLLPQGRGRGLAATSVAQLSVWALRPVDQGGLGLQLLVARCAAANLASHAVVQRAGYQRGGADDRGDQLWIRRPSPA